MCVRWDVRLGVVVASEPDRTGRSRRPAGRGDKRRSRSSMAMIAAGLLEHLEHFTRAHG